MQIQLFTIQKQNVQKIGYSLRIISKMTKVKKQTPENTFEMLLAQKYCKQFHIIDNPTIAFSLANKSNSSSHSKIDNSVLISDKQFTHKNRKQKSQIRKFYHGLKAQAADFVASIFNCLQQGKFALSEFFEYEQLVLSGFFKSFVEKLKAECWEKGDFLQYIWTQNMKIMQKILSVFQKSDSNFEISKNLQLKQVHEKYSNFIQSQALKIVEQALETSNLKDIIEILVQKLRVRRKQVKKLFKDTQQLLVVVNQFKDKNVELEIRYLNLIESNSGTNMSQLAEIAERKERLNLMFKQILTIENALYKNSKPFIHEVYLEKPLQAEDFIKEATQIIHDSKITNEEAKAEIDIIFDKYEQDFEDTLLKFKRATKKKIVIPELDDEKRPQIKSNHEVGKKIVLFNRSSQTTTHDKLQNNLIKNFETNVNLIKVIKSSNSQIQTNHLELKSSNFIIGKTTQFNYCANLLSPYSIKKSITGGSQHSSPEKSSKTGSQQSFSSSRSSKANKGRSKMKKSAKQLFRGNIKSRFSLVEGNIKKVGNLNRKSIQMEAIEEENYEGSKRQIKQNLRSFSAIYVLKNQRQMQQNNNFNLQLFEKGNKTKVQNKQKQDFQIKTQINQIEKHSESLQVQKRKSNQRRASRMSKMIESSQISSFNQKKLQSKSRSVKNNRNSLRNSPFSKGHKMRISSKSPKPLIRQIYTSLKVENASNLMNQIHQQYQQSEEYEEQRLKYSPHYRSRGYVDLILLKALQAKRPYRSPCVITLQAHSIKSKLASICSQSQSKSKQYELKSKKFAVYTKHNNLISIISSVFTRAYHRMQEKQRLDNYLELLYESMTIIYGNMPKEEIYKKIVNFLAQVVNQKNDHICRAFAYMLKVDESDQNCNSIEAEDSYLYMRVVSRLSLQEKPFEDIAQTYTDFNKINQCLPELFAQESIPAALATKIVQIFKNMLLAEGQSVNPSSTWVAATDTQHQSRKLNLFYCAKIVLQQVLQIKSNIKSTFGRLLQKISKAYRQKSQRVEDEAVDMIIALISENKVSLLKNRIRVEGMGWRNNPKYWLLNQFATAMLKLQIQNFEDLYINILNKFKIVNQSSHNNLILHRRQLAKSNNDENINQQVDEILLLEVVQKQSTLVLQAMLGSQFIELFGLSVILLAEI